VQVHTTTYQLGKARNEEKRNKGHNKEAWFCVFLLNQTQRRSRHVLLPKRRIRAEQPVQCRQFCVISWRTVG
jgi:hypothetical protein